MIISCFQIGPFSQEQFSGKIKAPISIPEDFKTCSIEGKQDDLTNKNDKMVSSYHISLIQRGKNHLLFPKNRVHNESSTFF